MKHVSPGVPFRSRLLLLLLGVLGPGGRAVRGRVAQEPAQAGAEHRPGR